MSLTVAVPSSFPVGEPRRASTVPDPDARTVKVFPPRSAASLKASQPPETAVPLAFVSSTSVAPE